MKEVTLCEDCEHRSGIICGRPQISFITGYQVSDSDWVKLYCEKERLNLQGCGPDARYFEAKK